ncbi:TonB-dependent siderophore receptor [Acidovorax sp. LjRoot194]|uniref:TonB-dependent siderophore receptor n=1 Tax=Acidovorax sp. LjRoot194 TaxID=3342280 RepID=UPI003ECEE7E9
MPSATPACLARAALLSAALCVAVAGPVAQAQPAPAATAGQAPGGDTARAYAIAPGPLAVVVSQFANAAGVALSFDAAQLGPQRSPGLQGQYTVEAGFARLLEGSALQAVRASSGVYTLRAMPRATAPEVSGAQVLAPVTVTATAPTARTEQSGSYTASTATVFAGPQPVRGIAQPVTVLTRQWLDDRALPDLHAVMQHTPGITVDYTDSERVNYYARGHQIDALQVDGMALSQNTSASIFIQPDTAVLDRVEVLRGAAGLLRGAGNPSATVNMVRKRPEREFQASTGVVLGSWSRRRIDADLSAPLNDAGSLRGRLVAVADSKKFFQQARAEDRKLLYGVVEADLAPGTTLTASLQHTELDATGAWGGLPAGIDGTQLHLPRSTYLGTDWNRWDRHNDQAFIELAHRAGNGWSTRLSAAHNRLRSDGFKQTSFTSASSTDPYLVDVSTSIYGAEASDQSALALSATGPFELLGRTHTLSLGADTLHIRTTGTSGHWGVSPLQGVDLRTWNPATSYPEPFYSPGNGTAYTAPSSRTGQQGAYAMARLSLAGPLNAIVGARVSGWRYRVPAAPASNYSVAHEVTPYAGLVYDLGEHLSLYGSYAETFTPQDAKGADGRLLAPIRGKDVEAGMKGEFMDGRLAASLSLFRIHQVGRAMDDLGSPQGCPSNPAGHCQVAGGKTRSQGLELEVSGEPRPGWQVLAGYTHTRTWYLRDADPANTGQPLRSIDPRHALRLFAKHRLDGALRGWSIGAGARVQSDGYVTAGDVTSRQGGYAVIDAMLGYRIDARYSVQVNVNNVLDKVYYAKFAPNARYFNNYYGDPRNVVVSLRANF